jgi:hypothetical protein
MVAASTPQPTAPNPSMVWTLASASASSFKSTAAVEVAPTAAAAEARRASESAAAAAALMGLSCAISTLGEVLLVHSQFSRHLQSVEVG